MTPNSMVPFLVITTFLLSTGHAVDYCTITCNGDKHTMCIFHSASKSCVNLEITKTSSIREEMMNLHNDYRNKFANQEYNEQKERGFPKAANMKQMYWDTELENIAKRWAEQCDYNHDKCRNVPRFSVGQNIATRGISLGHSPEKSSASFKSWVDEIKDAEGKVHKQFESTGKVIGHFTQVAWADSNYLGCAEVLYDEGSMRQRYIVCNYGPAGNIIGRPIYAEGDPCSKCAEGLKCGGKYKNLCADPKQKDSNSSTSLGKLTVEVIAFIALTTAILK